MFLLITQQLVLRSQSLEPLLPYEQHALALPQQLPQPALQQPSRQPSQPYAPQGPLR